MKHYVFFALFICTCTLAGLFTACNEEEDTPNNEYPVTMNLDNSSYKVLLRKYETLKADSLYIFNSLEDVQKVMDISKEQNGYDFSEVDFTKNTVLFVIGVSPNGIAKIKQALVETAKNEFVYSIEVLTDMTLAAPNWEVYAVIPKLDPNAKIELHVTNTPYVAGK